jgi:hypothetical protein
MSCRIIHADQFRGEDQSMSGLPPGHWLDHTDHYNRKEQQYKVETEYIWMTLTLQMTWYSSLITTPRCRTRLLAWKQQQQGEGSRSIGLIDYLHFYVPLKNFSLIWRRHHCRWRAAKFRPMLGAQGVWAGRDLYRATPAVTRGVGFSGLIWRTAPFSRLLRHTRGCGGSILTRILTGQDQ